MQAMGIFIGSINNYLELIFVTMKISMSGISAQFFPVKCIRKKLCLNIEKSMKMY